jgi:hypothetical protein
MSWRNRRERFLDSEKATLARILIEELDPSHDVEV